MFLHTSVLNHNSFALPSYAMHTPLMANTKSAPKKRGRQPDASSMSGKIRELLAKGMMPADIAKELGAKPALVYNVKARMSGGPKKRGPGRPPKAKGAAPTKGTAKAKAKASNSMPAFDGGSLESIVAAIKSSEQQRAKLRGALERIHAVIADVLA